MKNNSKRMLKNQKDLQVGHQGVLIAL